MVEGFVAYQAEVQEMYVIAEAAVCNMDKNPISYAPHHKYTISKRGTKLIKAKWLLSEVKITAALTTSKAGQKLTPSMIFFSKQTVRANTLQ